MGTETSDFDAIFCTAIAIASAQDRAAYIASACASDSELRDRVERLVNAHFRAGSFMEVPAVGSAAPIVRGEQGVGNVTAGPAPPRDAPGAVIGHYKLREQIGEGGFGIVFMAEQTQPVRRKVALKILKPGMDSRQVIARFEAERQALALMDHPNIAHVFDGGETHTGRPYFVMELVRGIPITEFCDQNCVPVRERLELFVTVCQAVQHAHQKGIIHRDLKPSNVMVTLHEDDKAVVKVIDFGIAKAMGQQLTDKTLFTNFAQMIGTPLYMSPEQARMTGLDLDTRTDIYSLGVLLYELLTGTTPFDQSRLQTAAYDEVLRIIREEDPPRPSTRLSTLGQAAATVSAHRKSDPTQLSQLCRGELDWIVMKTLEKDRNSRYETATGLARDVEHYLRDEPVQACPPSAWYRFRKFARRNKAALTTAVLLVATLLLGSGISVWQAVAATLARNAETEVRRDLEAAKRLVDDRAAQIAQEKERAEKAQKLADFRAEQIGAGLKRLNAANALVESGRLNAGFSQWEAAEKDFGKAVRCAAENASVWSDRGRFYVSLGLWDLAAADFARAYQRQNPESVHAWLFHALLRLHVGDRNGYRQICKRMAERFGGTTDPICAETLARAGVLDADPVLDRAQLVRLAERAVASGRESWRLDTLGLAYYRVGQFAQAALCIDEAQALSPTHYKAGNYAVLAMAHHRQGRADLARKDLDEAGKTQTERIDALLRNAPGSMPCAWWDLLQSDLHYREAKILIDGKGPPDDARLWVVRGRALSAIGRAREAAASFGKATDLQPDWVLAWTERAIAHCRQSRWDLAVADYSAAIALGLNTAEVWQQRGMALAQLGQYERAAADFAETARINPNDRHASFHLAKAKLGAGDLDGYARACARFRERFGKTTDPLVASFLLNASTVTDQGVPLEELARWGKLAVQRGPRWPRMNGYAFYRAGQYEAAIAAIQDAGKAYPLRGGDLFILAMAEHRLRRREEAKATYARAILWIAQCRLQLAAGGYWHWTDQVDVQSLRKEAEALMLDR